ncbi:MAG: hypothetical protein QGG46_07175 [Gammaproteobacteria bacterium]|nr:hypothetical protein [Gammaproteobacteria bacterium]
MASNLRRMLAEEAARLIRDHGIEDFRTAKSKAAERFSVRNYGALPSNFEIEQALAERNRIFGQDDHASLLASLRNVAVTVMHELQSFRPCLVGPVLSGNVTEHSTIDLHLFSDASENIGMQLQAAGIRHSAVSRRHRIRRDRFEQYPGYRFFADDFEVQATVFPERRKGHAPLCPVNGKPMQRAGLRDVESLAS